MTHVPAGSIVVGVDGSPASDAALAWAVDEAVRRDRPLHLIHAREDEGWWLRSGTYQPPEISDRHDSVLAASVLLAQERGPRLDVTGEAVGVMAAAALVERSGQALLVVVGGRGRDILRGVLLGSVSRQVATHAACPVVVVHDEAYRWREGAGILVGVDGSPGSALALELAFGRADDEGLPLTAVHATRVDGQREPADTTSDASQDLLTRALAPWREKYPRVQVRERLVRARPVDALVAGSAAARLLVVGSRGSGGFSGLRLGSVGFRVLQRAHCPVAVVPPARER